MARATLEGSLSCLYPYQYWMHWSNTILSCWYPSKLAFRQHKITGIFRHFMHLFRYLTRQLVVSQPTTMLCVTNCYAVCDSGISFTLIIPSPWATVLCLFSLSPPPLRTSEGAFSSYFCSLFSQQLVLNNQTLSSHYHFYRSLTTRYCFLCPLFLSPSLIPTSSSQLAYLHCNINSKLYSMLSTCLSVSPSRSLLSSLPLPPSLVSLQGESQWDWEAEAEQDDCLHHRIVRHGAHLQCTSTETGQTNHPTNGCISYEVSERKWQYQRRWVVQTIFSHWPGMSNQEREM